MRLKQIVKYKHLNCIFATIYPDWIDVVMKIVNSFRRKLWKEVHQEDIYANYQSILHDKPFLGYPVEFGTQAIAESFVFYNSIVQKEFFMTYPNELIYEPKYGWAMTRNGELIIDSLPYTYYALLPGIKDYIMTRHLPANTIKVKAIASLRDVGDKNYYHFYNDHLVKLAYFDKVGINAAIPLLISKVLYSKPYFQEALSRSGLNKRNWIVQDQEYVLAEKSHFVKTMPITKNYIEYVMKMLKSPKPNPNKNRKIFIDRGEDEGRCISNINEIRNLLSNLDFEVVNLEGLSLSYQMKLFSEAGMVVGIHGAGLANIIFRAGESLKVIEIFPPNNIPGMFYWTSCRFGFKYGALLGEKSNWKRAERQQWAKINFYLDPEKLKYTILNMQ